MHCSAHGIYNMQAIADGNNLYILWEHETVASNGQGDHYILFKHSMDGGKTFSEATTLYHSDPRCTAYPRMAVEGSNVYVMWEDGGILFKASNNNGTSFGKVVTLGEGFLGNVGAAGPPIDGGQILAKDDRVYAIWNSDGGEIIFRRSDDGGRSFGPPVNVSKGDSKSFNPKIAISGNDIYAVWAKDIECAFQSEPTCSSKILFARSNDSGITFGNPMPLDKLIGGNLSMPGFPRVAADGNNVYLLWEEKDHNIYFSSSSDRGQTLSGKSNLSKDYVEGARLNSLPSLRVQDGKVYVLWQVTGENGYVLLKSEDGGKNFERTMQPMSGEFKSEQSGNRQMIITKGDKAYLLWSISSETERRVSFATGYEGKPSTENQTDLVKKEYSSRTSPPSNALLVASHDDNNDVYVLWIEDFGASESSYEQRIFMRASADGGKTFGNATMLEDITTVPEFGTTAPIVAALATGGAMVVARFTRYKRTDAQ